MEDKTLEEAILSVQMLSVGYGEHLQWYSMEIRMREQKEPGFNFQEVAPFACYACGSRFQSKSKDKLEFHRYSERGD